MSIKSKLTSCVMLALVTLNFDGVVARLSEKHRGLRSLVPRPRFYRSTTKRRCSRHGVTFELHPADYMQWTIFANELVLRHTKERG